MAYFRPTWRVQRRREYLSEAKHDRAGRVDGVQEKKGAAPPSPSVTAPAKETHSTLTLTLSHAHVADSFFIMRTSTRLLAALRSAGELGFAAPSPWLPKSA